MDNGGAQDQKQPRSTVRRATVAGRCRSDRGGSVVETAMLLPFLTVAVFGTIDIGRVFTMKSRVTNMAREGAAFAQYQPRQVTCTSLDSISSRVKNEDPTLAAHTVSVRNLTQNLTLSGCNTAASTAAVAGDRIEVTVTATNFKWLTPFAGGPSNSPKAVSGRVEVVFIA